MSQARKDRRYLEIELWRDVQRGNWPVVVYIREGFIWSNGCLPPRTIIPHPRGWELHYDGGEVRDWLEMRKRHYDERIAGRIMPCPAPPPERRSAWWT